MKLPWSPQSARASPPVHSSMTPSNKWWILCALALSFVARFGSCSSNNRQEVQPELFIFNELCALKDDVGPCKAILHRFFFNVDTGLCEVFQYGGCGGNANNFLTINECEETCVVSEDKDPCHLDEAPGPCRGLLTRYFFDTVSQQCKHFYYGGCFGNANNFQSMSECRARCETSAKPTKAPEVHTMAARRLAVVQPITFNALSYFEICSRPVDTGPCNGAEKRYAFNPKTKRCQIFLYSGCGGNVNNFALRKDCIAKCIRRRRAHGRKTIRLKKKNRDILTDLSE